MRLFDLHCDTLTEMFKNKEKMTANTCHISFEKAFSVFEKYKQVLAIWSDNNLDAEENYNNFFRVLEYSKPMLEHENFEYIISVEGGRLLCGDLSRLDTLYNNGVRILNPVWEGECCVGGAYDTDMGLTAFGRQVIEKCFDIGILPDMSHASDRLFYETADIAAKKNGTIFASHSCSRNIFNHPRNITDDMAKTIAELDGVIGVSLVTYHLGDDKTDKICEHIKYFSSLIGEDKVCLGCDFDGTDMLPRNVTKINDLTKIYELLCENEYSTLFADKVFYSNAQTFVKNCLS